MTQNEQILAALRAGPLTPLQALDRFGCFRLAARIGELRQSGHDIRKVLIDTREGKRIARYWLLKEARNQ